MTDLISDLRDHPGSSALLFDIDGVLAPIVPHADDARVPDDVLALLAALADRYLLVGAISGRGMADVDRLVPVPGMARGGNHGLEVAMPGGAARLVPGADGPVARLRAFIPTLDTGALSGHGAWMEDKGASVSLHFRQSPDPVATSAWLQAQVRPAAEAAGLRARDGRMVLELLPDVDVHKGTALRAIVEEAGARRVLYVGDDVTDADAWRTMRALLAGGAIDAAHCVLADGPEVDASVRDAADRSVDGPDGVRGLMRELLA